MERLGQEGEDMEARGEYDESKRDVEVVLGGDKWGAESEKESDTDEGVWDRVDLWSKWVVSSRGFSKVIWDCCNVVGWFWSC